LLLCFFSLCSPALFYFSILFLFYFSVAPRDLLSFPTRRSSDLPLSSERSRCMAMPLASWRQHTMSPLRPLRHLRAGSGSRASVPDRKSTRLNSSHQIISYAVFCLKKKKKNNHKINSDRSSHQ